ncbi:MAG: HAD hydrolase family protein [Candidatus Bathyarchaeota archaeon]|nr:HAD hydrolase family protein [Candidatus Termiticorpusculum sp.]
MKGLFVSDCEGPISKNDNAYELSVKFIPNGDRFFCNVSRYDDVLADVFNKPGYMAGSTLKLILPFLKAYDVTDHQMEKFSSDNIILIEDTQNALKHIESIAERYIVSTSYEHYIKALCNTINFPYKNTYCTKVSLDSVTMMSQEKNILCEIAQEISQMPLIAIPSNAKSFADFSLEDQALIKRFDEIFREILQMSAVSKIFSNVVVVGGEQKAESIRDIVKCLKVSFENVMYVGDSITDVEALRLVKENGGLSVSFNGNSYAVKNADAAVISESNLVTAVIADVFYRLGREETLKVMRSWGEASLGSGGVDLGLVKQVFEFKRGRPKVQIVTSENMSLIVAESSEFRKSVRGVAIGRLG